MTRSAATLAVALAAALLALAAPGGAVAQRDPRVPPPPHPEDPAAAAARRDFYRGEKLFALGRFAEALRFYEAAFQAEPLPELLFNIGQCHRNLGDYDAAIFSFRKYLKLKPDAANRAAVEELITELEAARDARRGRRIVEPPPAPPRGTERPRLVTRWWFWTGVAVVAGAATGTAIFLTRDADSGIPSSDLGNLDF